MYVLFFLLWVIFNGKFTLEIAIFGLVIAAALLWFCCRFVDYSLEKEKKIYGKIFKFLGYVILLVKEILLANKTVMHLILTQKEEVQPMLVKFRCSLKTPGGRAFLANAVTLTPGTITAALEGDELTVHCLDESLAEGLRDSAFEHRLSEWEK